jgi:hypothetical protein
MNLGCGPLVYLVQNRCLRAYIYHCEFPSIFWYQAQCVLQVQMNVFLSKTRKVYETLPSFGP